MRSLRPLLLIPLASCAAPEHAEAPDFSWAWRAEVGQPITLDPAQSGDLLWSVVDAPEGSALWSTSTVDGSTFTFTPDEPGEVTLSVERCELQRCVWGTVSVQVGAQAPSSQRLGTGGLGSFGGVKLPTFGMDRSPIAAAAATVSGRWIELDGTASTDPDGDTLSYSWTLVSAPAGVSIPDETITGANEALAELKAPKAGTYKFQLTVSAKRRFSSVKLSTLIVRVNDDLEPFPD
jgi:hypothetical protein